MNRLKDKMKRTFLNRFASKTINYTTPDNEKLFKENLAKYPIIKS